MPRFVSLPERRNENIKYFVFQREIELTTCRVYSHTLLQMRHDQQYQIILILNNIFQDGEILPSQDSVMFPTSRNGDAGLDEDATDPTPTVQTSKKVIYLNSNTY